jgi:hypothetical protein
MRTVRLAICCVCGLAVVAEARAWAQGLPVTVATATTGLPIGEGTYIHAGVGAEVGYDTNVFYQSSSDQTSPLSSGILRVLPFIEINNRTGTGTGDAPGIVFDLSASLQYRRYLSDDSRIDASSVRDTFAPTISGIVDISPGQQFAFTLSDTFNRTEEPPYVPTSGPILRDANQGFAQVRWSPGGGRIQGLVRYTNRLDWFEQSTGSDYSFANSIGHEGLLDASWRWFPKTALFVAVQQGYIHYLNSGQSTATSGPKYDSYPLRASVGLRGLITQKLSLRLGLGYTNAFYSGGPNTSGFGFLVAQVDATYQPTLMTTLSVGYEHDFQNSIIGNFYNVDAFRASLRQTIIGRIVASVAGRYELRRFSNSPGTTPAARVDNATQVSAGIDYSLKTWAYIGAAYTLALNNSNAQYTSATGGTVVSADYVKQQVVGRIGFTY